MIKCNQCDSRFECNNTLVYHIKENHSQELTCEECGFSVNTANSMKEHMIEKHRIEQIDENPESIEQFDGHIERKRLLAQRVCASSRILAQRLRN